MKPRLWREIAGFWQSFNKGVLVGMGLPLLALVSIVAGVYLWTRKIPFLADIEEQDGERRLILKLMEPAEAQVAYRRRRAEFRTLRERIRTEAEVAIDEVEAQHLLDLAQESE
jgi:hypothetical protein